MAEGTIKIKEMEELTELTDNDYFVVDNLQSGVPTKKYKATRVIQMIENVADEIEEKITPSIDTALAVGSASGDIASFSDGSNLPMPKLQVGIEPVQEGSGDPSPTNVRPISGHTDANVTRCGKNLAITQSNNSVIGYAKKGQTYTVSFKGDNRGANIFKNNRSGTSVATGINPLTFTADEDFNIFLNAWNSNYTELQLEIGNTATEYEPYNGQTYNIQFTDGSNPLTVYGGSLDVVSGVLTITHGSFRVGDVNWTRYSTEGQYKFQTTPSNIKGGFNTTINDSRSTSYKLVKFDLLASNINCFSDSANTLGRISVYDQDYINSTAEEFKAGRADVMFTYELATPITYQLTPTEVKSLLGQNNVWADCGEIIDCEYKRDATAIINSLIARIEALENQ